MPTQGFEIEVGTKMTIQLILMEHTYYVMFVNLNQKWTFYKNLVKSNKANENVF